MNMHIYISGTIGIGCAAKLFKENSAVLHEHFAGFFIKQTEELFAEESEQNTQAITEKAQDFLLANGRKCIYISTIAEGGIFGALWKACSELDCGCEADIAKIPVRQEVVEICELFSENPYEADSSGCLLIICKDAVDCKKQIKFTADAEDITLAEIGHTTDKKDRVVINGENRRFLTPPERQNKDIANRKCQNGR